MGRRWNAHVVEVRMKLQEKAADGQIKPPKSLYGYLLRYGPQALKEHVRVRVSMFRRSVHTQRLVVSSMNCVHVRPTPQGTDVSSGPKKGSEGHVYKCRHDGTEEPLMYADCVLWCSCVCVSPFLCPVVSGLTRAVRRCARAQ